ncbi:sensor histidine kinase [Saccharopolyspora gloriosae]|uniref:sensor histidine kinase n=1 Tax=Saccharopolyspora gloriosae TaxID=455344 RepID=UPI001FB60A27|nr:histidine kinase [Saccharopolyspora gloriosae]
MWGTSFYLVVTALAWAFAEVVAARRAHLREVEERLRRAKSERDRQARLAVAEERNRIAREIHDVLAHSLTVMIAQSDGAAYTLRADPEQAIRAIRAIGTTGRTALAELRGLLDVLRDPLEEGQWAPQPAAASLRELVDGVRRPDLPVRLELTGNVEELPTGLGLAVHRIVQEALTNVLKHGGGATVVWVTVDDRVVTVDICDDGTTGTTAPESADVISAGGGLAGMWERAALYGGTLTAGPRPEGGWRVLAVLPLPHSDAA